MLVRLQICELCFLISSLVTLILKQSGSLEMALKPRCSCQRSKFGASWAASWRCRWMTCLPATANRSPSPSASTEFCACRLQLHFCIEIFPLSCAILFHPIPLDPNSFFIESLKVESGNLCGSYDFA